MKNIFFGLIIFLFFSGLKSYSQSVPVGTPFLENYYRRAQLLGNFNADVSFTIRPLFSSSSYSKNIFDPDSTLSLNRNSNGLWRFAKEKGVIQFLPIVFLNQLNSHHPDGINDGAMIPSRGMQTFLSAGVFVKYGPLSIQLRPEFISAQNLDFNGYFQDNISLAGIDFLSSPYRNRIDLPERFGTGDYKKAFWGQSSLRITVGPLSIGVSNENLWWGPGYRSSLLMTNSAAGFKHFTLNTAKPIKTFIGSFEAQLIGGKLEGSDFAENFSDDWRYINATVLNYQPKWVPGLFLGASRSFLVYYNDMGRGLADFLPVFIPLSKGAVGTNQEVNNLRRNQLLSVFARWMFIKSHSELYFEFGRNDHSWDLRDFILEPSHSSTYIIGLRKLFLYSKQKEKYIQLILEATNLAQNQTTTNRFLGYTRESWYAHGQVRHGYTNEGQLLGAGIGPGSNLQTFDISWVKSLKQIGIQVERYVHNNDFWYDYIKDIRSNWVDLSAMAYANWDYKNLLLTIKLKYIKSYNYQWMYEPIYEGVPEYWAPSESTRNFHGQLGFMYRF